jgi:hypothetical protein
VQVVGERTREERDAEGRKRAIDVEDASRPAGKRRASEASRALPAEAEASGDEASAVGLETRVSSVRSRFTAAQEARVKELLDESVNAFVRGEINGAALEQRKEAAAAQAQQEKGDPKLDELLAAFSEHASSQEKVEQAKQAFEQAKQAERAARAKVEELLRPFEAAAAGSSGAGGAGSGSDVVR